MQQYGDFMNFEFSHQKNCSKLDLCEPGRRNLVWIKIDFHESMVLASSSKEIYCILTQENKKKVVITLQVERFAG